MEVYSNGEVGPFLYAISDEKNFDNDRYNPVSIGGEVYVEVEDQDRKFVTLSNENIDTMKEDDFYSELL